MDSVINLVKKIVSEIVDDVDGVLVELNNDKDVSLIEVKVSKDDVGKVIGKGGRVASAIRTIAKSAGAKNGCKVMVNVFNKPRE